MGRRYADLIGELIWRPMEPQAQRLHHRRPSRCPTFRGGICAIIRDLALAGQLIANGGTVACRIAAPSLTTSPPRLQAGRARWLQRTRLAQEQGLIANFPNGRRPRGAPKRSADPTVRRGQRIEEAKMAQRKTGDTPQLPVKVPGVALPAVKPRAEMSKREKLDANADRGLDVTWEILNLPVAFDNLKLLREQREVALASSVGSRRRSAGGAQSRRGAIPWGREHDRSRTEAVYCRAGATGGGSAAR